MSLLTAAIPVVGNLLGGLFGRNSEKKKAAQERSWALEDQAEQFVRLRAAAEKGGFNPLSVLGAAPGSGMVGQTSAAGAQNYMGEAIATSSLMLADSLAKTKAAASGRRVEDLNRQRDILTRKLAQATLRPKQPGIYDRARNFGTGRANANAYTSDMGASSYFGLPSDPRLDVAPKQTNVFENMNSAGSSTDVPVGHDLDEMFGGWVVDQINRQKTRERFENTWEARAGRAQRFRPAPPPPPPQSPNYGKAAFRAMLPPSMWMMWP